MKNIIIILAIALSSCAMTPEQKQQFADEFSRSFNAGMKENQRYDQIRQEEAYRRSLQSTNCTSVVTGNFINTNCY